MGFVRAEIQPKMGRKPLRHGRGSERAHRARTVREPSPNYTRGEAVRGPIRLGCASSAYGRTGYGVTWEPLGEHWVRAASAWAFIQSEAAWLLSCGATTLVQHTVVFPQASVAVTTMR